MPQQSQVLPIHIRAEYRDGQQAFTRIQRFHKGFFSAAEIVGPALISSEKVFSDDKSFYFRFDPNALEQFSREYGEDPDKNSNREGERWNFGLLSDTNWNDRRLAVINISQLLDLLSLALSKNTTVSKQQFGQALIALADARNEWKTQLD